MTERARRPGSLFSVVRKHCSASQKRKRAKKFALLLVTNNSSPSLGIFANLTDSVHLSHFDYKTLKVLRKLQVFAFSPGSLFSVVRKHCSASQKRKRLEQSSLFGLTLLCPRRESNLTGSVPQLSLTYFCINNK